MQIVINLRKAIGVTKYYGKIAGRRRRLREQIRMRNILIDGKLELWGIYS